MRATFISVCLGIFIPLSGAFSGRDIRPVAPRNDDLRDTLISVRNLRIIVRDESVNLQWRPALRNIAGGYHPLNGYLIEFGENIGRFAPLDTTTITTFYDRHFSLDSPRFYRVFAQYGLTEHTPRNPRKSGRDRRMLLDFEEDLELLSYNRDEDIQPNRWEISEAEALPGGRRSLRLFGNTWKRLPFPRTDLTDSTVWRIGTLVIDADDPAQLQAFGLGDGSNRLFYVFSGDRLVWEKDWVTAYQDVQPRDQWNIYNFAVGYDWKIRFGRLPAIDELYFINDNDGINPSSQIFFDDLIDLTDETMPSPKPKVRWRIVDLNERPGWTVEFQAAVDNRNPNDIQYRWDFGDGSVSNLASPQHTFTLGGRRTVGLETVAVDGKWGGASIALNLGGIEWRQSINAAFVGDVMLARRFEGQDGLITRFGPEYIFEPIRQTLLAADLFVINLECPLTDEGQPHPTKSFVFRSRPDNVAGLVYARVDIAGLANNHIGDYGERGLEETMEVLNAAGISFVGSGLNEYEALKPVFKTFRGIRVGVLAYCNRTGRDDNVRPFLDAAFNRYGYAYFSADNIIRSVPEADELCDILIVEIHGGTEYAEIPQAIIPGAPLLPADPDEWTTISARVDSATRELAHLAIDLGADLVIGHHPHILQGFEIYQDVPIAHSLGNFVFDQNLWETWPSAIVWAELSHQGVQSIAVQPVFVNNYRPFPATGALGEAILRRLAGYCRELNSSARLDREQMRLIIPINPRDIGFSYENRILAANMRFIEEEQVWRSEPVRLDGDGFPSGVAAIEPFAHDAGWEVSFGRDILLVGNMESEGADVWNYNSNYEGRDSSTVRNGRYSSYLYRGTNWRDAITDLTQRIPVNVDDRLTLAGWLRITNGRDAGLAARFYRFRYDNDPGNITGEQTAERRLQGDADWTFLWDQLTIPEGTAFVNVRWQLFGPAEGEGLLWADDVVLVRWDRFIPVDDDLTLDIPNDFNYLQVQTRRPVETIRITYRSAVPSER